MKFKHKHRKTEQGHVISPGGRIVGGGNQSPEPRKAPRSSGQCMTIWLTGMFIGIGAIIGMISGFLGGITGVMDLVAGILYFIAGQIAESDRKANKIPSQGAGAGAGGERKLGWFYFGAILLLVGAFIYGISRLQPQQ